jgi:hypothetical protein
MENEEFERLLNLVTVYFFVGIFILIAFMVVAPFLGKIINLNYVLLPFVGFYSILSVIGIFIILTFFISKIKNRIKAGRRKNGKV